MEEGGWMNARQVDDQEVCELRAEIRRLHGELAMSHSAVRLLLMEVEALREWRETLELNSPQFSRYPRCSFTAAVRSRRVTAFRS